VYRNVLSAANVVVTEAPTKSVAPKLDIDQLWDKISESITKGDREGAELLLHIYTKLQNVTSSLGVPPSLERSSSADACLVTVKPKTASQLEYINGAIPNHFDVGFAPFAVLQ
jgi:hypothetical protein